MSQEELAQRCGPSWNFHQISRLESGKSQLEVAQLPAIAVALGVTPAELLPDASNLDVRVDGVIGENGEVLAGSPRLDYARCPAGIDPAKTIAVEMVGDAMLPVLSDGWVMLYRSVPERSPAHLLNRLCVALLPDGRRQLGNLRASARPGRFNLIVPGRVMPLEDLTIAAAYAVRGFLPPEVARPGAIEPLEDEPEEVPPYVQEPAARSLHAPTSAYQPGRKRHS